MNSFVVILFLIGMLVTVNGIRIIYGIDHAADLSELSAYEVKKGRYVCGEITEYLGYSYDTLNSGRFYGESIEYMSGLHIYHIYTLPMADGKYLQILLKDEQTVEQLKNYEQGRGQGVFLEGRIGRNPIELNYDFYEYALGTASREETDRKVQSEYVLYQTSFQQERRILYAGAGLIVTALFLFLAGGGIKNFYEAHEN